MLDRLKNVDMSQVKECAKNYASHAKSYAKSYAGHAKTYAKTYAKTLGAKAVEQAKYMSNKRAMLAGRSVNPFVVGAAAIALISGVAYLLLRNRSRKMHFAGHTQMEGQEYPVK